jgi:6,7-dimethyl-8-ribityllumazine synthase
MPTSPVRWPLPAWPSWLALGVDAGDIRHVTVPGALEVPWPCSRWPTGKSYDALIALGCIIRGETYHFELVANESGAGVSRVSLDYQHPVANAILTTENEAQAWARQTDKGRDAARVAVEMANLLDRPLMTDTTPPQPASSPAREGAPSQARARHVQIPPPRARAGAAGPVPVADQRCRNGAEIEAFTRDLARVRQVRPAHFDALLHGCIAEAAALDAADGPLSTAARRDLAGGACGAVIGAYELTHCIDMPYRVVLNEAWNWPRPSAAPTATSTSTACSTSCAGLAAPGGSGRRAKARLAAARGGMKVLRARGRIEPFYVMEVRQGGQRIAASPACDPATRRRAMIFLNIGEPDFTAPPLVQEAAERAIRDGRSQYTDALGLPAARGHQRLVRAALRPAVPCRPHHGHGRRFSRAAAGLPGAVRGGRRGADARPQLPLQPALRGVRPMRWRCCCPPPRPKRFQLDAAAGRGRPGRRPPAACCWPARPTPPARPSTPMSCGASTHRGARRGGITLVDEIYLGLSYDDTFGHSALAAGRAHHQRQQLQQVLQHDRLAPGLAGAAAALVAPMERLAQNLFICASTIAQHAALACFEAEASPNTNAAAPSSRPGATTFMPALNALGLTRAGGCPTARSTPTDCSACASWALPTAGTSPSK